MCVVRHPPQSAKPTQVLEWDRGRQRRLLDELAAEEPLEIRVGGTPLTVTMRTPGSDFDLAAGFLLTEGMVRRSGEIARIAYARGADGEANGNVVDVSLTDGVTIDTSALARHFPASSSCGICGKATEPNPITPRNMVERAVNRAEERAAIALALDVVQLAGERVQTLVQPVAVARL